MTKNERKEETALEKLPELEIVCPECKGKPWSERGRCEECHGSGVVPTMFGKQVLDLVRHNRRRILLTDEE